MASASKTTNYQLNQWAATDQVRREDFNSDNQKVDTALKSLDTAIQAVSTAFTAGTKIVFGSYVGTGTFGQAHPTTLDFTSTLGRPPKFVMVVSQYGDSFLLLFPGMTTSILNTSEVGTTYTNELTWSGNSVSYYCTKSASGQLNYKSTGYTEMYYYYFAIG